MEPLFLAVAFILGFSFRQLGLPPMIGFLAAGFALNALGYKGGELLDQIADLGVILLLFSIGLKLNLKSLLKPEIWATTSLHMALTIVLLSAVIFAASTAALSLFAGLDRAAAALIAFGLSFSSTVFAIKALEDKTELNTTHGRIAIGILVMQDIIAVLFITVSAGKIPSAWALGLFALPLLRPLFFLILDRSGHGELLPLFGLFAAIVIGAELFDYVGLKDDLGALLLGVLLAKHPRASEISKSLLNFKDILLIGFFLNIGLTGVLSLETVAIALLLVTLIPFKTALFFLLLTRLRLRARSSLLTSLSLSTYSEFGLIVGALGVANSWLPPEWLTIIAVALAISFVIMSPVNVMGHTLYARAHDWLVKWETNTRHPDDLPISTGNARIAVLGMGRVGSGAYDTMQQTFGYKVIGLESNPDKIKGHRKAGRNVILADATDSDFWDRVQAGNIEMVMLTLPELSANLDVIRRLVASNYSGKITAVARFPDEVIKLQDAGVDLAVDSFTEAGVGFADHVQQKYEAQLGIKPTEGF